MLTSPWPVCLYQRQYAKHYVLAQMKSSPDRPGGRIVVEVAIPNAVSATLETHIFSSLEQPLGI